MTAVHVVGVAMTPCGKFFDKSVKDLTRAAVDAVLADAGMEGRQLQAAFFSNAGQSAIEGQYMIGGQIALAAAGLSGIPILNVENACASASSAFHAAYAYVKAGLADIVLAVGAEKLCHPDKAHSFRVFDGAWDASQAEAITASLALAAPEVAPPGALDAAGPRSVFMDVYAAMTRRHMKQYGTTRRQLAAIAAKNHGHSVMNPFAQFRMPMTVEEVLAARPISWPLTLPMCAPISDGAAAAILVSDRVLAGLDGRRSIRVDASVLASGTSRPPEDSEAHVCRRAALRAYEMAGIGPDDVDVAEVHDATAFGELVQIENLGLVPFGEGGPASERGETTLGGRVPVNPSGGLESKGHPIGATGLGQIFELVTQLRGEAGPRQVAEARVAVAENGGGYNGVEEAAACITILSR